MGTVRRLAAIMFTDITGYSTLMEADEFRAREIRNRHRDVFKEAHGRYGGKILQYFGDGTLSIFDSTASAVECAVAMQIAYRQEPSVPLRIGIHTGDIAYDDEGAYGDGLNIASRLEGLCIPGGVFISAKVFDDIRNHAWLTAVSLGFFQLHNISRDLEVFAVTSRELPYPTSQELQRWDTRSQYYPDEASRGGRKKKGVAFLLALFMGMWGIHRFYLGQKIWGIIHFVLAVLALIVTVNVDPPFPPIVIFLMLGFLDAILLLAMPKGEFDMKYNKGPAASVPKPFQRVKKEHYTLPKAQTRRSGESALGRGIEFYKKEEYGEAILSFKRALEEDPESASAYFNLACCYAILRNTDDAYLHLAAAVKRGFDDYDRIENHEALTTLRNHPDFEAFRENGYRQITALDASEREDILELPPMSRESILDQLEQLGDKLERGELTRDEFDLEKQKLLRS